MGRLVRWCKKYEKDLDNVLFRNGSKVYGWPPGRYFLQHPDRKQLFNVTSIGKDMFFVSLKKPIKKKKNRGSRKYVYYEVVKNNWGELMK